MGLSTFQDSSQYFSTHTSNYLHCVFNSGNNQNFPFLFNSKSTLLKLECRVDLYIWKTQLLDQDLSRVKKCLLEFYTELQKISSLYSCVCSGSPRSSHPEGIRYAQDLLGEKPMRNLGARRVIISRNSFQIVVDVQYVVKERRKRRIGLQPYLQEVSVRKKKSPRVKLAHQRNLVQESCTEMPRLLYSTILVLAQDQTAETMALEYVLEGSYKWQQLDCLHLILLKGNLSNTLPY